MQNDTFDTIILGSGPSGLTATIYTSRAHLKTLVIAGNPPGGQLTTTTDVENFPGFPNGVMGPKLIEGMRKQAERFGAKFENKNALGRVSFVPNYVVIDSAKIIDAINSKDDPIRLNILCQRTGFITSKIIAVSKGMNIG